MKRFLRLLGVIGGIGAVIWAMRDRFISLAVPREPEPPTFRPVKPERSEDLTEINGIGPAYQRRLSEVGVRTRAELAAASASDLAEKLGISEARAASWVSQANKS